MNKILQNGTIDKLLVAELRATLDTFLAPVLIHLPEKRLGAVGELAVQGIIGGQSPLVTQMARGAEKTRPSGLWRSAYIGSYETRSSAIAIC